MKEKSLYKVFDEVTMINTNMSFRQQYTVINNSSFLFVNIWGEFLFVLSLTVGMKGNVLFNNILNTFYLRLYGIGHMVNDHSHNERENLLPPLHLAARVLLYAPSHRQDSTYHSICYIIHWALAETGYSWVGPPWGVDQTTQSTMSGRSSTELHLAPSWSLTLSCWGSLL